MTQIIGVADSEARPNTSPAQGYLHLALGYPREHVVSKHHLETVIFHPIASQTMKNFSHALPICRSHSSTEIREKMGAQAWPEESSAPGLRAEAGAVQMENVIT